MGRSRPRKGARDLQNAYTHNCAIAKGVCLQGSTHLSITKPWVKGHGLETPEQLLRSRVTVEFEGVVKSYEEESTLYHVKYADGDDEYLPEDDIRKLAGDSPEALVGVRFKKSFNYTIEKYYEKRREFLIVGSMAKKGSLYISMEEARAHRTVFEK